MSIIEIEIASIFSVFEIWFCIYTCLRSLRSMAGCIQNHRTDGKIVLSSTDLSIRMRFIVLPHCACAPCVRTDGQAEL